MISMQKQQIMLATTDAENAKKELVSVDSDEGIYRMVGPLFLKVTHEQANEYLESEGETSKARSKLLEKQEKKLTEKLNEMHAELQSMMKPPHQ